jgi:hypothetical protein
MNKIRELTEMEAEAVSGGRHHGSLSGGININVGGPVIETNISVPTAVAISVGGNALAKAITSGQTNKAIGFQL